MNGFKTLNRSASHRLAVLKNNTTLAPLSLETLQPLAENAVPLRLRKGATLWQQGDSATSIACIVQGILLIQQIDPLGHTVYYHLKTSGALIGHTALAAQAQDAPAAETPLVHQATIAAREETVVLTIASAAFQSVMDRDPSLVRRLLRDLSESIHMLMNDIFTERVYQGKYLLAAKLLSLAAMEGAYGGRVYLRYSQRDLSCFTGLGVRNINKFLADLPAIRTKSGRKGVYIESIEALRTFLHAVAQAEWLKM